MPLHAQPSEVPDSVVVARLAPALFRALDHVIASASRADSLRAVRFTLPDSPAWSRVGEYATNIVKGRPLRSTDTNELLASVTKIAFERDTLSAIVTVGSRARCPDGSWQAGGYTQYRAFTVRHGQSWEGLTVATAGHGDSFCSRTPNGELSLSAQLRTRLLASLAAATIDERRR
jgi:hypothetical protein